MDINEYNARTLAYVGDAIYELYIREHIAKDSYINVNHLQQLSKKYVSAKAQACIFETLSNYMNEEELQIFNRGRNAKTNTLPKNTPLMTYKISTGFEAVMGYLYLKNDILRLQTLINKSIKIVEKSTKESETYEKK